MSSNSATRLRHPWLSGVRLAGLCVLALVTALTLLIHDNDSIHPDNRGLVRTLQPSKHGDRYYLAGFFQPGRAGLRSKCKPARTISLTATYESRKSIVRMASQERHSWVIRADRGVITRRPVMMEVSDQYNQMTLQGQVRILRQGDMAQQMMLSTSQLHIFPTEQRAQTDMPVFLEHERFTTSSEGFDLDLETGALTFAQNESTRVTSKLFLRD